ncbi:MAG: hypothetical protein C0467_09055 [Planctomycetaceae bacterium]|nr:hypothetical protein [Planctomycetaceae bacterium]
MNSDSLVTRLERIEAALTAILDRETVREWYGVDEISRLVGRGEFTVREWCRRGRLKAVKRGSGRGKFLSWVVSHDELKRFQRV